MMPTEFLLDRIAEDEAVARAVAAHGRPLEAGRFFEWMAGGKAAVGDGSGSIVAYEVRVDARAHIARHDPARVLAGCEALRRIVERYAYLARRGDSGDAHWVLRMLAAPYADHPDFDPEWRLS